MTTTNRPTTGKSPKATREVLTDDEMRTAHELHALAHTLYGHLSGLHPWAAPMAPFGFDVTSTPWSPSHGQTAPPWASPR